MTTISVPEQAALDFLDGLPDGVDALVWDGLSDPPDGADTIEFFVGRYDAAPPAREVFEGLARLRVIQVVSAGAEKWLPVVPAGVALHNGRGVHGASTAELAVAGMLASLRGLPAYLDAQRRHEWRRGPAQGLDGRRVLVLGAGDIGERVANVARLLGASATLLARTGREHVKPVAELPALLPEHDVVVLALPLTAQTDRLVDARFLASMPDGSLLVNVARGAIVDTDALLHQLRAGRVRAFLDVTEPEPLPPEHPLWDAPNLILTPHVGGGTAGWRERAYRLVVEQVTRYVNGDRLRNRVETGSDAQGARPAG